MLNTMAIQLLAGAETLQKIDYFDDTVVYKAIVDGYFILVEVKQNPDVLYDIRPLTEMLDNGSISVCSITITDTALRV